MKPLRAGDLRFKLNIYRAVQNRNDAGETVTTRDFIHPPVSAGIRTATPRERERANVQEHVGAFTITMRYRRDLRTDDLLVQKREPEAPDRAFTIAAIENVDERNRELRLTAFETTVTGVLR